MSEPKKQFKVTLLAESYESPRGRYPKGWHSLIDEADPRLPFFKSHPAFKVEPTEQRRRPTVVLPSTRAALQKEAAKKQEESKPQGGVIDQEMTELEKLLPKELHADLAKKGLLGELIKRELLTPADVLEAGKEDLLLISGIGEKTAEKIIAACTAAMK